VELDALARRAVEEATRVLLGDVGEGLGLLSGEDALDDLGPEHHVAVARVVLVQPVPLEPRDVVVGQGVPPVARGAHQLVVDVEPVLLELHLLGLVHEPSSRFAPARRRRTNKLPKEDRDFGFCALAAAAG
jgi:hypothetical protein